MEGKRVSWIWPAVALASALGLRMAHWSLGRPVGTDGLPVGPFVMVAGWAYVEWMMSRGEAARPATGAIHNMHRLVFTAVGLYTALYNGLALAADATAIDAAWKPLAQRGMGTAAGVMLAAWGNHLPKLLSPWRWEDEPFDWQGVHRVVGWLAAIGGVVVAAAWMALLLDTAEAVTRSVVGSVFILALATKMVSLLTRTTAERLR